MATDLRSTAMNPYAPMGQGQPAQTIDPMQSVRSSLFANAMSALRGFSTNAQGIGRLYQQYIGQPAAAIVGGGGRGFLGLDPPSYGGDVAREMYRVGQAMGNMPVIGAPAGAFKAAASGVQALPAVAGEIGRIVSAMPTPRQAAALQAADFAQYQRAVPLTDVSPLTAYHGTPHRFEPTPANPLGEFRAAAIGSGEGAQAYGFGMYFAESPGVAKGYRNVLSDTLEVSGDATALEKRAAQMALTFGDNTPEGALKWLTKHEQRGAGHTVPALTPELVQSVKAKFENGTFRQGGSLYTVDIPDEMIGKMLDWDKPLSQQPKAVREFFEPIVAPIRKLEAHPAGPEWGDLAAPRAYDPPGSELMQLLGKSDQMSVSSVLSGGTGGAASSAKLQAAGIPGIRYLDAGSRGGPDGTRNIVVFPGEESKVKILSRD